MTAPAWEIRQGDVLDRLREIPDRSVHCVVTSPPYWGLRLYVADGTPEKPYEMGLEPTPEAYLARMVEVFREVRRVLRRDGTCWVNMGDGYNSRLDGSHGGWNGSSPEPQRVMNDGAVGPKPTAPGLKPKDLIGMPWRLAFALQADGWWLRSDIVWAKPNPMPESVTDRPTKAHEYLFLLARNGDAVFWTHPERHGVRERPEPDYVWRHKLTGAWVRGERPGDDWKRSNLWAAHDYYYDADAIREPHSREWAAETVGPKYMTAQDGRNDGGKREGNFQHPAGRNARSVWTIATQPFPEAHFATFPPDLARRCILAGTSERGVCPECGAPWRRVVERSEPIGRVDYDLPEAGGVDMGLWSGRAGERAVTTTGWEPTCGHGEYEGKHAATDPQAGARRILKNVKAARARGGDHDNPFAPKVTTGWDGTCSHALEPVPATVLDPFAGSGTTVMVAVQHGRSAVGIELSPTFADMARRRVLREIGAPQPLNGNTPDGMAAVQGRFAW